MQDVNELESHNLRDSTLYIHKTITANMVSTQPFQVIPHLNEDVLREISSHLPDERQTLGAVRLASKNFKKAATPFFITRASFAFRVPSWIRLHWLINHPEFSRYIKEFFFDASVYEPYAAMSRWLPEPWALKLWWDARKKQTANDGPNLILPIRMRPAWPEISCLDDYQGPQDRGTSFLQKVQQSGLLLSSATQGSPTSLQRQFLYCLTQSLTHPSIQATGLQVSTNLLTAAFAKLKNLKTLVVGDFRDFAYHQESYSDLCGRLFGSRPAPRLPLTHGAGTRDSYRNYWQGFWDCASQVQWTSLAAAKGANFGFEGATRHWELPGCIMGVMFSEIPRSFDNKANLMNSLVNIRLTIGFVDNGNHETPGDSVALLSKVCPNLRHLSLKLEIFAPVEEISDAAVRDPPMFPAQSCTFPVLEFLELRKWSIGAQMLIDLLERHKRTLLSFRCSCPRILVLENDEARSGTQQIITPAMIEASFQKFVDEHMVLDHYSFLW